MKNDSRRFGGLSSRWLVAFVLLVPGRGAMGAATADDPPVDVEAVLEQAARIAALNEAEEGAGLLASLGAVQARLGRAQDARDSFRRATILVEKLAGDSGLGRLRIAIGQELAGFPEEARATRRRFFETLPNVGGEIGPFFRTLAANCLHEGDFAGARDFAERLPEGLIGERGELLLALASGLGQAGRPKEAAEALAEADARIAGQGGAGPATSAEHRLGRAIALAWIARAEARGGDAARTRAAIDRAAESLGRLPESGRLALGILVLGLARRAADDDAAGADLDRAILMAGKPAPGDDPAGRLSHLATLLAQDGDPARARRCLATARDSATAAGQAERIDLLVYPTLVALGDWGPATAMLQDRSRLPGPGRIFHLRRFARARAKAGEGAAALDLVEAETEPEIRVYGLIGLLEGLADRQPAKPPR